MLSSYHINLFLFGTQTPTTTKKNFFLIIASSSFELETSQIHCSNVKSNSRIVFMYNAWWEILQAFRTFWRHFKLRSSKNTSTTTRNNKFYFPKSIYIYIIVRFKQKVYHELLWFMVESTSLTVSGRFDWSIIKMYVCMVDETSLTHLCPLHIYWNWKATYVLLLNLEITILKCGSSFF